MILDSSRFPLFPYIQLIVTVISKNSFQETTTKASSQGNTAVKATHMAEAQNQGKHWLLLLLVPFKCAKGMAACMNQEVEATALKVRRERSPGEKSHAKYLQPIFQVSPQN